MCKDNVDLPKEANKAKCFVVACFVLCASPWGTCIGRGTCGDAGAPPEQDKHWHIRMEAQPCARLRSCSSSVFSRTAHAPRTFACSFFSCTAYTCGSSLFSMIGFGAGWAGSIGAFCGILACIGSSILMCCAPASVQEGGGKFTAVRKSTRSCRAHPTIRVHHASPNCAATPLAGWCAASHRWHHPSHHVRDLPWLNDCLA